MPLSVAEVRLLAANRSREVSAKPREGMEEEIGSVEGAMSGTQQRLSALCKAVQNVESKCGRGGRTSHAGLQRNLCTLSLR